MNYYMKEVFLMNTLFIHLDLTTLEWNELLYVMAASVLLGFVLSLVYIFTHRKMVYDRSFVTTLIMLPLVIAMIILLISNASWAAAFSLAGVFALVRFRTVIADSKDLTYILSTVAVGIACAMGELGYGLYVVAFISIVLLILHFTGVDKLKETHSKLTIVIPENIDYNHAFKDVFDKYLANYQLNRVRTTDFGSLFEVQYLVRFKPEVDQKAFIDDIRVRNNNLTVTLVSNELFSNINDK